MKHPRRILLTVLLATGMAWAASSDEWIPRGLDSITAGEMRSELFFLASDEMEGRAVNTAGNRIATRYLALQFEAMRLRPLESVGGFLFPFELVQGALDSATRLEFASESPRYAFNGTLKEDFLPSPSSALGSTEAPLLFAGFGLSLPERHYDDYAGVDAAGKVVLVMDGRPEPESEAPGARRRGRSSEEYIGKVLNAQAHGASAVILFSPGRTDSFGRIARYVWPEKVERTPFQLGSTLDKVKIPALYLDPGVAESVLKAAGYDLETIREEIISKGIPHSFDLNLFRASLNVSISRQKITANNVLGYLPGSDPELRDEFIIVGAHFDHVGTDGDDVYNGADDDGTGTVAVMEIAEAFAESPIKPRRSVLFALWNAEESGLIGSRVYVDSPPVPLADTVAVYNLDMIGRSQEVTDADDRRFGGLEIQSAAQNTTMLHVVGGTRSGDLRAVVETANRSVGLDLRFDMDDHRLDLLRRSDSWSFLARGVPAIFFTTGIHPDYHSTGDRPEKIEYDKLEKVARLAFLCVWESANSDRRPVLEER